MWGACLVTEFQLVGGGQEGLAEGDSASILRRSALVAELLAGANFNSGGGALT